MTATLLIASAAALAVASGFYLSWLLRYDSAARRLGVGATLLATALLTAATGVELSADGGALVGLGPRVLLLLTLGVVGIFLLSRLRADLPLAGPVIAPLAFAVVLALAVKASRGALPESSGNLGAVTVVHIGATLLGFMHFVPAYVLSVLFLDQEYHLKMKTAGPRLPSLLRIEQLSWRLVLLGFPIFSVGILLGLVWQEQTTGSVLRPEHLLAATGWLIYGVVCALRIKTGWRGRRAALALMAAFVVTLSAVLLYVMR